MACRVLASSKLLSICLSWNSCNSMQWCAINIVIEGVFKVALHIFLSFEVLKSLIIFCLCFKVFLVLRHLVFSSSINVQFISERESRYWKAEGSIETWRIYSHSYSAINTWANTVPWSVVPRTGGTLQEDDWKNSCCLEKKRSAVKHENFVNV